VEGELLERTRLVAVARLWAATPPAVGRDRRITLFGVGRGVGLDLHHIGDLAVVQPLAELTRLAIAGIGNQHRRAKTPPLELIQHVQHQPPLGPVPHPLGQLTGRPPVGVVPALGQEQPPVQRAARLVGDGVDRHPSWQLAVLPSVPEYCRCTPTECSPSLGKPVSSTAHATGANAVAMTSASRRRTGRQSHGETATKWCNAW
jgi:hypothetical protein